MSRGWFELRYPPRAHTPADPEGRCEVHAPTSHEWRSMPAEGRIWRTIGEALITDRRHGRIAWGLAPGTSLRLDGEDTQGFRDGYFGLSGDYLITTRYFCVLDGPMKGTCWEATDIEDAWDPALSNRAPVAPVSSSCAPPRGTHRP